MVKTKFCLVGAGSIGRRHLRLLLEREDVEICVAEPLTDRWAEIQSTYPGVTCYASMEEAIEKEKIEAVIIATPHTMHTKMVLHALNAGLHVFCEKPMSDSLEECVAMLSAAEKSSTVLSIGFMFHFDPFIQKVKELLDTKAIGNIVHYSSRFASYNILLCSLTKHQLHTPYSLVMDCIHDSDLLCYLTGKVPDYAFSNALQAGGMELTSPQNIIDTTFRFEDKSMAAHIHFNYIEHPQVHALEIVGDKGYIQGDFMEPSITIGRIDGSREKITITREIDDLYRAQWDSFIKAVHGTGKLENPAKEAIYSTLIMQAQKESAEQGTEVSLHEIAKRYGFDY